MVAEVIEELKHNMEVQEVHTVEALLKITELPTNFLVGKQYIFGR